eukprot:UN07780
MDGLEELLLVNFQVIYMSSFRCKQEISKTKPVFG